MVRMSRAASRWWTPAPSLPAEGARVQPPRCSECSAVTVEIDLSDRSGGWHLIFEGVCGAGNGNGDPISAERAQAILDALSPPYETARIQAAGFYDDMGFCTSCAKFYCPTHWQVSSTGGGTCPAGHFKSLDPHWRPDGDEL